MEICARLGVRRVLLTRGRSDRRFSLSPITTSQPQSNVRPGNSRASIVEAALVDKEIASRLLHGSPYRPHGAANPPLTPSREIQAHVTFGKKT